MRIGKVMSVSHYLDDSYGRKVSSVHVTILEEYKIFGIFKCTRLLDRLKYGYYGEELKVGDMVAFELDLNSYSLAAIVRLRHQPGTFNKSKTNLRCVK